MDERLTHIAWIPVDEHDRELDMPEDSWLPGGGVRNVPSIGDAVVLNGSVWTVTHRLWTLSVPDERAQTPRQMCTLRVRKVETS